MRGSNAVVGAVWRVKSDPVVAVAPQAKQLKRSQKGSAAIGKQPAPGMTAEETGGAYYRKYILQDLEPWAEHGITEVLHVGACADPFWV